MSRSEIHQVEIVPARLEHVAPIAENMRREDVEEVLAATGRDPLSALQGSFDASVLCWTGTVDGAPACMFGVAPIDILGGVGAPWLLGTDLVPANTAPFLRRNKAYVARMLALFPCLFNYVDARNRQSIRWLKWLGFDFDAAPVPYGIEKLPFFRFTMRRANV